MRTAPKSRHVLWTQVYPIRETPLHVLHPLYDFVKFGFHYIFIADAVALQDGLNTFTSVLIHAESHMRKTIAEHVQVFMDVHAAFARSFL